LTRGTDDKEIRSRVIQARKCIACLNGILWSKDIRQERKLNIYNVLIKNSLLCGSETWRLAENKKRWVEATETDALRRSSGISRKERIRNVTIRQQIGLEEPIIKEIEQNQLTWYDHVKRMAEGRLPKIALKWMPKQKRARGRPKKIWVEGIRKVVNERNLNEGQWEDRKRWSLGVGQHRTAFWNRHSYTSFTGHTLCSQDNEELCDLYSSPDIIWVIKKSGEEWIARTWGTYGRQEKCLQGFGGETWWKKTPWKS